MSSEIVLTGQIRSEFGKGAARRLRRAAQIPAVLYGHGVDPIHLSLPDHATQLALRTANALLRIEVEGEKARLALPKQVQRDPIKGWVKHVDLIIVRAGEKVEVEIPIQLVGEVESGMVAMLDFNTVTVEAPATKIPALVEINIDGLTSGDQITLADLVLPEGSSAVGEPETMVLSVSVAPDPSLEVAADNEGGEPGIVGEEAADE